MIDLSTPASESEVPRTVRVAPLAAASNWADRVAEFVIYSMVAIAGIVLACILAVVIGLSTGWIQFNIC